MKRLLAAVLLLLYGCSTTPDILLRKPATGETARCEGVPQFSGIGSVAARREQRECVEDYQRAGYDRVPDTR
jgi:hypothetical protein